LTSKRANVGQAEEVCLSGLDRDSQVLRIVH
jgi:hypothetical protein